ncbi:MAG: hypothetical protein P0Y58_14460 [Candidatus Pseudomonas phytovorans]|uniref:Uncharacterized protein n=1 Tax=Candidatus Pseudomonas phytovorans TaxID=3121377 RepID=A0AAJ5WE98_9PSED|nr:hypothetical protein [Pseudomonas sp.]WEK28112.1 MAG: hypothetical protein P0Y58_14460 [Pseudomonas sp.]
MKSTKCIPLLVIASVLSFAAHADDSAATNCEAKIKQLEDFHKASGQAMHGGMAHDFKVHLQTAKDAQKKGDMAQCNASAGQAKAIYDKARSR